MKLSASMQLALDKAKEHGGELHRWPGGFWTYPGCDRIGRSYGDSSGYSVPLWHCGTNTVMALVSRGVLEITSTMKRGDPDKVKVKA